MTNTIVNKIKKSVQSGTGLTCLYGSLDSINVQMGDQTEFPVAFFVLLNNGSLDNRSSNYRERVDVAMFFVKPTEFDFESIENEAIISECKQCAFQWLNSLFLGGDLRYITTLNTSRVYNQMDDILTGYALRVRLEELVGECAPEPFRPTRTVTATSNDDTMGTVTGGGEYYVGDTVTLTATKDGDRTTFVSWTVGESVVSTDPTYTFTATEDVTVVGNFSLNYFRFIALEDNSSVGWTGTYIPDIQYSKDGSTWTQFDRNRVTVNEGESLMFKGDNWRSTGTGGGSIANYFTTTGSFDLSGNIMSLLDSTLESVTIPIGDCFFNLFLNCSIVSAENLILPATTLMYRCYENLFNGCTSLTTAPALPAIVMASECYAGMFGNCTSLTTAPELPATTLAEYCYYYMFYNCTALTTAPELPATTLADTCYFAMFSGCTSLTTAPELPATNTYIWQCYGSMFSRCTSLTEAPHIGRTIGRRCYYSMFNNCTSLNSISVEFTVWNSSSDSTLQWVGNVSPTGTFHCPRALPIEYGTSRIPTGWTVEYID